MEIFPSLSQIAMSELNFDVWLIVALLYHLIRMQFNAVSSKIKDIENKQSLMTKEMKNGITERLSSVDKKVGELDARCNERHRNCPRDDGK